MVGVSLVKRLIIYLFFAIFFGFAFTAVFFFVSGYSYIFGFFQDSLIIGACFGISIGLMFEALKIITTIKFKKIRFEILQANTVIFNSVANRFNAGVHFLPATEGWLFLTDEKLIKRTKLNFRAKISLFLFLQFRALIK